MTFSYSAAVKLTYPFIQGLSRSTAAAIELFGNAFGGIVVSDRLTHD